MNNDNPAPFAILYLPDAKAGQTIPVYGRSAKRYSFVPSDLVNRKPARIYDDPEAFAREELDIRRNPRPTAVVCTSIGPVNPVIRAASAVQTLIGSRQTVGAGAVRDALNGLIEDAKAGIEALALDCPAEAGQQQSPASAPASDVSTSAETQKPVTPAEPLPILNEPSLQALGIDELRELATKREVGKRSRAEMVAGILKKQQEAVTA